MTQIAEIAAEERTTIPILTATNVAENAARSLDEARRRVDDIIAIPIDAVTPENIFEAWDRAAIILEDAFGPISILNSVHPDKGVREAGDEALVQEATFMTELFQNERFYERVSAVEPQSIAALTLGSRPAGRFRALCLTDCARPREPREPPAMGARRTSRAKRRVRSRRTDG